MDKPTISVIIPVYNVKNYLDACMECVCKQTYKNLEIVIIDDGSNDSSGQMCDIWAKKDCRIRTVHKKNGGLSDARNSGIDIATGDYILFVDSDDLMSERLIEHLYKIIEKTDADIAICDAVHCYPGQAFIYVDETVCRILSSEEAMCEMMYQTSFLYAAWAKLYRRELFDNLKFPVGLLFEDVAIMYKVFAKANLIVYSNAKLYGYLHRANSITTSKFSRKNCDILSICNEQLSFAQAYSRKVYEAALSYQIVGALRIYLNAPRTIEFKKDLSECESIIKKNGNRVLRNVNCRKKLKISIILFRINKHILRIIYAYIDRWK